MEFLYNAGDWVIFGNSLPFKQVKQILYYSDDVEGTGIFILTKEFRYSYDYESWSIWSTLTATNLNTVNTLEFNLFENSDIIDNWNEDEVWGISFSNGDKWKIKQDFPSPFYIKFSDNIIYEKDEVLNAGFFTVLNGPRTIVEISYFDANKPKQFWIQYKYTLVTGNNISINSVELEIEENVISPYSCKKVLKPLECGYGSPLLINTECDESFAFNDQNNLLKNLFLDLNTMVASIAGLTVEWFKFNPVANSEDVLFHEWTLYEVESPKYINVVVPGGKMPDSKPLYNPYDIDFEMPFEIHISKKTWESIFGLTIPQKRDIVWISQTNKVWEVASSYLQREFSGIGVYYKVFLTKYQPRNNAIKSLEVDQMLDEKILSQEEAFGELLNVEIEKIQKPELNTDDNIFDDMRNFVNVDVIDSKILNYFTTISKSHYDLSTNILDETEEFAVQYNRPNLWNKNENRAYSCWFKIQQPIAEKTKIDSITSLGNNEYDIHGVVFPFESSQNIKIWNDDKDFSFIIKYVVNLDLTVTFETTDFWEDYLVDFVLTNYTGLNWCVHYDNNFIYNYNNTATSKGISIDIEYAHVISLLKIKLNSNVYEITLDMAESLTDQWTGMFINISNEFKNIETNLYKIQWNIETNLPKTNKLVSFISNNTTIVPAKYNTSSYWEVNKSKMYLTNIRVWNTICQVEFQSKILNQYVAENSDLLIVSDIANEQTFLPLL